MQMKLLQHFLNLISGRRRLLLGAISQPNTPQEFIHAVRTRTFLKLTGKPLTTIRKIPTEDAETDISSKLSPSRRLLRKGL